MESIKKLGLKPGDTVFVLCHPVGANACAGCKKLIAFEIMSIDSTGWVAIRGLDVTSPWCGPRPNEIVVEVNFIKMINNKNTKSFYVI